MHFIQNRDPGDENDSRGRPNILLECVCNSPYMDKLYGKGLRPHNTAKLTSENSVMCIVCLKEKPHPLSED